MATDSLLNNKILVALDSNSRQSYTQIAKKCNTSKETARLRIAKLEKHTIQGYYTLIDFAKLGYVLYLIYFKTTNMTEEEENIFNQQINSTKNIGLNVTTFGEWNRNIAIWAKNVQDFENTLQQATKGFQQHITKTTIMIESYAYYSSIKLNTETKNTTNTLVTSNNTQQATIDEVNKTILSTLSKDARVSAISLAEKTKISSAAIAKRIKQLEKKGIIKGYKIQPFFKNIHAKLFFKFQQIDKQTEQKIALFVLELPHTISVSKTYGNYSLECRVQVKNIQELDKIKKTIKNKFPQNFIEMDLLFFITFQKVLNYFPE